MTQQIVPEDHASAAVWRLEERNSTLNFVYLDARKERKMIDGLDKERINDKLKTIGWKFIPPDASHMAGVVKRLVRSVKTKLRGILENETKKLLSAEGLYTLLCEVECILNDRPFSMNPTGLDNASALNPNMLLKFRRWTITNFEITMILKKPICSDGGIMCSPCRQFSGEDLWMNTSPLFKTE